MQLLVVVFALVCATSASPVVPLDNSHYVENSTRYVWMSGYHTAPQLVDLKAPVDHDFIARNGANNQYWLFTRNNPTSRQVLVHNNANSVRNSNFNEQWPIVVVVHGWNNDGNSGMNPTITSAVLAVQNANVIVVDWSSLANSLYSTATAGVPSVGQHLGNFLVWLVGNFNANWNNVHLVGFSLGAHVVGVAGRQAGGRPVRITGLDPANPGWSNNANALSTNAGVYVEVIHTDGNSLGLFNAIGHTDFYPNGGTNPQPGCLLSICSHGRAPDLFASSVRTNHFVGRQCPNVWEANLGTCFGASLNMGNNILTKRGSGIYHLRTGNVWPY